jgi:hypothetical protein
MRIKLWKPISDITYWMILLQCDKQPIKCALDKQTPRSDPLPFISQIAMCQELMESGFLIVGLLLLLTWIILGFWQVPRNVLKLAQNIKLWEYFELLYCNYTITNKDWEQEDHYDLEIAYLNIKTQWQGTSDTWR